METTVSWIMGLIASVGVLTISIIFQRWFKLVDRISQRITDLEKETQIIKKDIEIIKIDLHHDIKDLNKQIQHLSESITRLNERL